MVEEEEARLRAVIVAEPDELAAWIAYADYLLQRDDPRGEIINVELAAESTPDDRDLKWRRLVLRDHEDELYSPRLRAQLGAWRLVLRRTFIHEATLVYDHAHPPTRETFAALLSDPHSELLASLTASHDVDAFAHDALCERQRPHLRTLDIPEIGRAGATLAEVAPRLETLVARASGSMGRLRVGHPNLRHLKTSMLACPALACAHELFPALESLRLRRADEEIAALRAVFSRPPPNLVSLSLCCDLASTASIVDMLAGGVLAAQLSRLELSTPDVPIVPPAAVDALVAHAAAFPRLRQLQFCVVETPDHMGPLPPCRERFEAAFAHVDRSRVRWADVPQARWERHQAEHASAVKRVPLGWADQQPTDAQSRRLDNRQIDAISAFSSWRNRR